MFESLTEKLSHALRNLRGVGKLSEENMTEALKEVRTALLGADVHFKVAREFVERVQAKCLGQQVLVGVTPGQQIVKIIHDELVSLLGEGTTALSGARPLKIMMVGLHGSGKTTSTVKLAKLLKKRGYRPWVAACDIHRPAAIDQLEILAKQEDVGFYCDRTSRDVSAIGTAALNTARQAAADCVIFDTAGRLQIDVELIDEVKRLSARVEPDEILYEDEPLLLAFREKVEAVVPGFCFWPVPPAKGERVKKRCAQLWQRISCDMQGNLGVCCGTDSFLPAPGGNLFEGDQDAVYNHPVLVKMREQLLDPDAEPPEMCKSCNLLGDPGW